MKLDTLDFASSDAVAQAEGIVSELRRGIDANAKYQQCFKLLKLAGLEAEIPRLVVFGQQSMGKTTLLDYIMGGPIGYSSTDTGTKMPILIMLEPTPPDSSSGITCTLQGENIPISELQESMAAIMQRTETIEEKELELVISVPNGVHAVFVDLPGIKDDSRAGAELTRTVVKNYVQNSPNDLYILVKKASDDPANWPYTLKEFILTAKPKGLGLTPQQTIVVGTRAKDFLENEKNDIRTQGQLLERVRKRAVTDSHGNALPLFLLELFSLSIEEKDSTDFERKRKIMNTQVKCGQTDCQALLTASFDFSTNEIQRKLSRFFDVNEFRAELNRKFQGQLSHQLNLLERRLKGRLDSLRDETEMLQQELNEKNPSSLRENIRLFIRQLVMIIEQLITGNYMLFNMPNCGKDFLMTYGGNLTDNLIEGDTLAKELFSPEYKSDFLNLVRMNEEINLAKERRERERIHAAAYPGNPAMMTRTCEIPCPDISCRLQPGQYIRFTVDKDESEMIGFVSSLSDKAGWFTATFFYTENEVEQTQSRGVEHSKIHVLLPMSILANGQMLPPFNYRCWVKTLRPDAWMGLKPVALTNIHIERVLKNIQVENEDCSYEQTAIGYVTYVPLGSPMNPGNLLSGEPGDPRYQENANLDAVFCEVDMLGLGLGNPFEAGSRFYGKTPTQLIAGEFADKKLLNQLALTHLARWLKHHINHLEPNKNFSPDVILQLMRSVRHVVDKADWEPLVADLLQANVKDSLLQLTKLASCATAVALRRIVRAAIYEIERLAANNEVPAAVRVLVTNESFLAQIKEQLETYCKQRAEKCAKEMNDLIFEQTHAVHFEMVQDFFEGCRSFEKDFLQSSLMDDVSSRVYEALAVRKAKLGGSDIYSRNAGCVSNHIIYEEVRVQFWVAKQLLAAPLTTKLYMNFVKDIKDKSSHLAAEHVMPSCQSELEHTLQQAILKRNGTMDETDADLFSRLGMDSDIESLQYRLTGMRNAERFMQFAIQAVMLLRNQIAKEGGVNFLTRLNLER